MAASATGTTCNVSKAVGWTVIVLLVVLLGTHPAALAGLLFSFLTVLRHAGAELSSFLGDL
jgi:hypothetical protein